MGYCRHVVYGEPHPLEQAILGLIPVVNPPSPFTGFFFPEEDKAQDSSLYCCRTCEKCELSDGEYQCMECYVQSK